MHRPRPSAVAPALVAVAALVAVMAACGDDDEAQAPEGPDVGVVEPGTELEAEGLAVEAPDGWETVPLVRLGFGLALPPDWEAVVLDEAGLDLLEQAAPEVPDFVVSAVGAYRAEAIFYAAGVDEEDPDVANDLKVRAATDSSVEDLASLRSYVEEQVEAGLEDAEDIRFEDVEDAPYPTVDVRYRAGIAVPHGDAGPDADGDGEGGEDEGETREVTVEGAERWVLAPRGPVYSFIVTGERAAAIDEIAPDLFGSLAFLPEPSD